MRFASLGLVLAAVACGGVTGCCDCALMRATRDVSLTAAWQEYTKIVVQTHNGYVEITRGTGGDAQIDARLSAGGVTLDEAQKRLDEMQIVAEPSPDDPSALLVQLRCPHPQRSSAGANLDIRVPAACAVEAATDNGRICVYDLGPATLETSNGRIHVERMAGGVSARSSNGRIVLREVAGECRAETSNGSIEIRAASGGGIDARTSNGGIDVDARPPRDASVRLDTSNGAIHALLPASMTADLEADTSLGDVDVEFGSAAVQDFSQKRDCLRARVNGGGGKVTASTSLGSITIKFVE